MRNNEQMDSWLRTLAQRDSDSEQPAGDKDCIPLGRWPLGLLHVDWTDDERRHIAGCARCRRVRDKFLRELWHPTPWELLAYSLGRLTGDPLSDVQYHLDEDACVACLSARAACVVATVSLVRSRWEAKTYVAEAADQSEAWPAFDSTDERLHVFLDQPGKRPGQPKEEPTVLEVSTVAVELANHAVRFALRRDDDSVDGFVVLAPGRGEHYEGHVSFEPDDLIARLGGGAAGKLEDVKIACLPIEPAMLVASERDFLLDSIRRDLTEGKAVAAWRQWAATAIEGGNLPDEAAELVAEVRRVLGE